MAMTKTESFTEVRINSSGTVSAYVAIKITEPGEEDINDRKLIIANPNDWESFDKIVAITPDFYGLAFTDIVAGLSSWDARP